MKIQIIKFESVDSTNNVALRRIKKGKIKPTLIIAKSQKKGRGQYGRKWISNKGNIFMTIYFSLKRKIKIKTLSKKVYKLIKKSLAKELSNFIFVFFHTFLGNICCIRFLKNVEYEHSAYLQIKKSMKKMWCESIPKKESSSSFD